MNVQTGREEEEREVESLVRADFSQRLNWIQTHTHTHPQSLLLLVSLRLTYSEVFWLFGADKQKNDPAIKLE